MLSRFPIASLLNLLTVSRRLHELVLRVLHYRILYTWPLPSHGLILEAYHPSGKWTEPYLYCSYLGTEGGLSPSLAFERSYEDCNNHAERCAKLRRVYSRFRPNRRDDESTRRWPFYGQFSVENSSSSALRLANPPASSADLRTKKVEHIVNLDSHELFSQLCLSCSLVKLGPVTGVFPSVVEAAGGVIRVWRQWLQEQATKAPQVSPDQLLDSDEDGENASDHKDPCILWVDWKKDIGLKVRVQERQWLRAGQAPLLEEVEDAEDRPVSYVVEIEEVIIRTWHLVLAIERSLDEQQNTSGKAMILGNVG